MKYEQREGAYPLTYYFRVDGEDKRDVIAEKMKKWHSARSIYLVNDNYMEVKKPFESPSMYELVPDEDDDAENIDGGAEKIDGDVEKIDADMEEVVGFADKIEDDRRIIEDDEKKIDGVTEESKYCAKNCDKAADNTHLQSQENEEFESIMSVLCLDVHCVIDIIRKLPHIERFEIMSTRKHSFNYFAQKFNNHYHFQTHADYYAWLVNDATTNRFKLLILKKVSNFNLDENSTVDLDIF